MRAHTRGQSSPKKETKMWLELELTERLTSPRKTPIPYLILLREIPNPQADRICMYLLTYLINLPNENGNQTQNT